ncbi:MAG: relaxase/mobilization nuclease domain-containing protein [Christensenella sp.]
MATVNFINRKKSQNRAGMKFVLEYTQRDEKTLFEGMKLVSGLNCSPQSVYQEFVNTKLLYGKDSKRMYYHFVQSFPPGENITPQTAHEIALKLAEFYKDFEVLIGTHIDTDHIHSHFIINSVSFETGLKFHQPASAIQELRQISDKLCMEYGLSICQPNPDRQRVKGMSAAEYHAAEKGESWKMQLINTIDEAMRYATSKARFIEMMEAEGYAVKWTDTRKNITYTTPEGKPCRDDRLHELKYLKERMEHELRIRQEIIAGGAEKAQSAAENTATNSKPLPDDTTGCGRIVRGFDLLAGADESPASAELQLTDTHGQSANQDGAGASKQEPCHDTANDFTGWEAERAFLFSAEAVFAEGANQPNVAMATADIGGIVGSVVQLGKALERMDCPVPIKDATAKPAVKEHKKGVGQKEDDHSGYDFEMKM